MKSKLIGPFGFKVDSKTLRTSSQGYYPSVNHQSKSKHDKGKDTDSHSKWKPVRTDHRWKREGRAGKRYVPPCQLCPALPNPGT